MPGICRSLEIELNRPLHWFVCMLHFNKLHFRHVFLKIDGNVTTGPKPTAGPIFNAIKGGVNQPVHTFIQYILIL